MISSYLHTENNAPSFKYIYYTITPEFIKWVIKWFRWWFVLTVYTLCLVSNYVDAIMSIDHYLLFQSVKSVQLYLRRRYIMNYTLANRSFGQHSKKNSFLLTSVWYISHSPFPV